MAKVEKIAGQDLHSQTSGAADGLFSVCQDQENNAFALWEMNRRQNSCRYSAAAHA